jgi:hypothetical protein
MSVEHETRQERSRKARSFLEPTCSPKINHLLPLPRLRLPSSFTPCLAAFTGCLLHVFVTCICPTSLTPSLAALRHVLARRLCSTFAALMDTTTLAISAVVVAAISGLFTFLNVYHYHPWPSDNWLVNALLLFYAFFIVVAVIVAPSTYFLIRPQPTIALHLLLEFTWLNGLSSLVRIEPLFKEPN